MSAVSPVMVGALELELPRHLLSVPENARVQFLPLKNWAAVLERFYDLAPTIAGLLENSNAFPTIDWTNGDDYDIANKKSKARAADAKSNMLRHDAQTSDQIHTSRAA